MIVELKQAFINRLNLETSRGTARKRPRIPVEFRNVKKTGDIYRNSKGYNVLL